MKDMELVSPYVQINDSLCLRMILAYALVLFYFVI